MSRLGDWDKSRPWTGTRFGETVQQLKLTATPAPFPDPARIEPREWLYSTILVRGFVSALVAPGGVGKTLLALVIALSLAAGRSLLGDKVYRRVHVWYWNGDDPPAEIDRRIAAIMMHFGLRREDLDGWFFRDSGRKQRLMMVEALEDGSEITYPDREAIVAEIQRLGIGLMIIDPFVKAHVLNENSNAHMDRAAGAWAAVAEETGCAIWVVHHTRKGHTTDADAARGGKALIDACRIAQVLTPMTEEAAEACGIPDREKRYYMRLDDVKVNLAPPGDARWFKLLGMPLGNVTDEYPAGDHVGVVVPWQPPLTWDGLPGALCLQILDQISRGRAPGKPYQATKRGLAAGWCGAVVMDLAGKDEATAKKIIDAWLRNGLLTREEYREDGRNRLGVAVDPAKFAEMRKQFYTAVG